MVAKTIKEENKPKQQDGGGGGGGPPPALAVFAIYILLGTMISFAFGRPGPPGTLPAQPLVELAPSMIVLALFLVHYECYDCMGVAVAKNSNPTAKAWESLHYSDYGSKPLPEAVYLAQRAQTNQVEQLPVLLVGTISCALYVNGHVAAVIAALWCLLRMRYGHVYRASTGMTMDATYRRIGTYTIPAYFCANTLVMAAAITALRSLLLE